MHHLLTHAFAVSAYSAHAATSATQTTGNLGIALPTGPPLLPPASSSYSAIPTEVVAELWQFLRQLSTCVYILEQILTTYLNTP